MNVWQWSKTVADILSQGVSGFDIWKKEAIAHHLGRVGEDKNSEVGQNIFKNEEDFGKWLDKVPDGLVHGWSAAE